MLNPSKTATDFQERPSPRPFVLRLILFVVPFIPIAALIEGYLWSTGETWPVAKVHDVQAQRPTAIWMRGSLDQSFYSYKWAGIERTRPRVLAVGSSRVMKFSSKMLAPESGKFYNAGGIIQNIQDLDSFASALTAPLEPQVIFLGIDMWWLNPAYKTEDSFDSGKAYDAAYDWRAHLTIAPKVLSMYRRTRHPAVKKNMTSLAAQDGIGLEAILVHRGFRADGYFQDGIDYTGGPFVDYAPIVPSAADQVRLKSVRFVQAENLSPEGIALLHHALKTLRSKGIIVCTFLPPVTNEIVGLLETVPGQSSLWHQYLQQVPRICKEEGTYFVDANSPKKFGCDDRVMVDGIHCMDTFEVRILREWLKNKPVSEAMPGTARRVSELLAAPGTNRWLPDYAAVDKNAAGHNATAH